MLPPPPPPVTEMLAGTRLITIGGHSVVLPDIDFETYSPEGYVWSDEREGWVCLPNASQGKKGLEVVGAYRYAENPDARVLSLRYNLKDGGGNRGWRPGLPMPLDLFAHVKAGGLLEAWGVSFERWVWEHICVPKYGFPPVAPGQWRCAMAKARSYSLPGKLELAGKVLNVAVQKDARGKKALDRLSVPRDPTRADHRTVVPPLWTPDDVDAEHRRWRTMYGQQHTDAAIRKVLAADAETTQVLWEYNGTDIDTEAHISAVIPDFSAEELAYWQDDLEMNHRGVGIDVETMEACISVLEQAYAKYETEFRAITGIDGTTKLAQFKAWLAEQGVGMESMDEDAVVVALARTDLPPLAYRALELRAACGSANVKKVYAIRNMLASDGRLHGLYAWAGARTGRPTGYGPQPTNIIKSGPPSVACKACGHYHALAATVCPWCLMPAPPGRKADDWGPASAKDAIAVLRTRKLNVVEHFFGDAVKTVAGVLRGLFAPAPGYRYISSDFSAIEGVVIAALANERWRLEVFAGHGKIYEMSAAKILGIPFEEMLEYKVRTGKHHPARQNPGKIAELGLGFGGWINAWRQFDGPGTDDEVKANILAWRDASPAIVYLWGGQKIRWELYAKQEELRTGVRPANPFALGWTREEAKYGKPCMYGLEGMLISAILNPGQQFPVMRLDGTHSGITYVYEGDVLRCYLPSGRCLYYHQPRIFEQAETWRGLGVSYWGYNTNPKNGPIGWIEISLYGGRAAENVTQAVACDIQRHAIRNCHRDGKYPVVMQTYDEVVAEVPLGVGSVAELEARMMDTPAWAKGWPIKAAGGWEDERYCKA